MTKTEVEALTRKASLTLGKGTFGTVHLVRHSGEERALKVGGPKAEVATLEKELRLMEHLAGAGGAPLALAFCADAPALLMSYRGRQDLLSWLTKKKTISERVCFRVALLVTEALEKVHAKGVVHCDFKTDNVVVETNAKGVIRRVHIIDFGLALREGGKQPPKGNGRLSWYCGCYYSEQPMTPACDLVGLGVLFQDLLQATEAGPKALHDMAARMQKRDHAKRPQL